jgi:hypothetical protein
VEVILKKFHKRAAFALSIDLVYNFSQYFTENYAIKNSSHNHDLIYTFVSKTKTKKLRSDIRGALNYLQRMAEDKKPFSVYEVRAWAKRFDKWQQYLTKLHLTYYYDRKADFLVWKCLGTSLHCLIDSLYHIFSKFDKKKKVCKWCGFDFKNSWISLLRSIVLKQMLLFYVFLSLSQSYFIEKDWDSEKLINDIIFDISLIYSYYINRVRANSDLVTGVLRS